MELFLHYADSKLILKNNLEATFHHPYLDASEPVVDADGRPCGRHPLPPGGGFFHQINLQLAPRAQTQQQGTLHSKKLNVILSYW